MGSITILIAEDDASMRRGIGRLLRAAGFDCIEFASAEDLLESAKAQSGACIVTDIHLPGLTGFDLVDRLRALRGRMPAVFITAYDNPSMRELALRRGNSAYLRKPFEGTALLDAIRKVTAFVD